MGIVRPHLWFDDQAARPRGSTPSVIPNTVDPLRHDRATGHARASPRAPSSSSSSRSTACGPRSSTPAPRSRSTRRSRSSSTAPDQAEVDHYWETLTADGGRPSQCGWLVDKFGVSWQVVPVQLDDVMSRPDADGVARAMAAMLTMGKLDIAALEAAYRGRVTDAVGGIGLDGPVLTIASVNVNGIRAAYKRGMGTWLEARKPDVILLQEVRATDEILADHLPAGEWHLAHEASETKGRAGVAIASRLPMTAVRIGLKTGVTGDSGRWVEADLELPAHEGAPARSITVVSTYLHSGTLGTPSMDEKYAFLDHVTGRLADIAEQGGYAVVAGDVNIAHREADIRNWKGNLKSAGFLPRERAYLDRWFDDLGWHDLGRELGGEGPGPFTWWSWRGKAFDNDAGWRIDYQLATPDLADAAVSATVDRAATYAERFSDHAPVVVEYDL